MRMLHLLALSGLVACASTVSSMNDASNERGNVDVSTDAPAPQDIPDGFAVADAGPSAIGAGVTCPMAFSEHSPCPPYTACITGRIRTIGTTGEGRFATPARCMNSPRTDSPPICDLSGSAINSEPGQPCLGFQGESFTSSRPVRLRVNECLQLEEEARQQARPGEEYTRCWYTDQTLARSATPRPQPLCPRILAPICGVGCGGCTADRICMFASETYPWGVCVGLESPQRPLYTPCRAQNPRMPCQRGAVCLIPIRNNADGIPDIERRGSCVPAVVCNSVARQLPEGYLCDNTLTQ